MRRQCVSTYASILARSQNIPTYSRWNDYPKRSIATIHLVVPENATMTNVSSTRWFRSVSMQKKSSLWSFRPTLVFTKPSRGTRTQSCHAINLTFKGPVVSAVSSHQPATSAVIWPSLLLKGESTSASGL